MWNINKVFLKRYLLLCLMSFVFFGHPWIQRCLVLGWTFDMARTIHNARRNGITFLTLIGIVCSSQLPGIILIFTSWSMTFGEFSEWPSGLIETWYHPFISMLEILPSGHIGNWSDMYLETCLIPAGIILLTIVCWTVTGSFLRTFRGQE